MQVVICGAGVIGCATAYYLSLTGADVTIVECDRVASGASGKSGGFLAEDWCDGNAMAGLARASFQLHDTLAGTLAADYGYRRVATYLVAGGALARGGEGPSTSADVPWLDGRSEIHQTIGTPQTTAQIEPREFTEALLAGARTNGTRLVMDKVTGVQTGPDGQLTGVCLQDEVLPAQAAVLTMGPWTRFASDWAALPPMEASKGHSIILRPKTPLPADALFVEYPVNEQERLSPEIVSRPNGEVYACGLPDPQPLPEDPASVTSSAEAAQVLHAICGDLSEQLAQAELIRYQACYRPIVADALPVMGAIPGQPGLYVSTGHNCWGMLNAPASGLAMSELITEGVATTVNLSPFAPERPAIS